MKKSAKPPAAPGILVTAPNLGTQGGVAGFYNAVLPHFPEGQIHLLQVGGFGKGAGFVNPLLDQWRFRAAIAGRNHRLVHLNPSLCLKCLVRDGFFAWQTKLAKLPLVVFWHGWDRDFERQLENRYLGYFRKTFGQADFFIVLARAFEGKLREWGIQAPIFCGSTAVDESLLEGIEVARKWDVFNAESRVKILFLARLERAKGVFETVRAVKILLDKGLQVQLTIAGDGPVRRELEEFTRSMNLDDRQVSFTGDVRGDDKIRILQENHIYCFPTSYGEGLPTSVLEAMAFAMPVVTRPVGGLADMFEDGKMGLLVRSDHSEEVAACLQRLAGNPRMMAEIGRYNGEHARKHFMASAVKDRLENIYGEVVR